MNLTLEVKLEIKKGGLGESGLQNEILFLFIEFYFVFETDINSSNAIFKFSSGISHYPLWVLNLPSLEDSFRQREEWKSIIFDILVDKQSIINGLKAKAITPK